MFFWEKNQFLFPYFTINQIKEILKKLCNIGNENWFFNSIQKEHLIDYFDCQYLDYIDWDILKPCRPDEDDSSAAAAKRNQITAVILCGVIGSLFDLQLEKVKGFLPGQF